MSSIEITKVKDKGKSDLERRWFRRRRDSESHCAEGDQTPARYLPTELTGMQQGLEHNAGEGDEVFVDQCELIFNPP